LTSYQVRISSEIMNRFDIWYDSLDGDPLDSRPQHTKTRTNIHVIGEIRAHDLRVQVIKAYATGADTKRN
jgi:hypothetical protein